MAQAYYVSPVQQAPAVISVWTPDPSRYLSLKKNCALSAHTVSWMTGVHVAFLFYEVIACLEAPCLDQWKYERILPQDLSTLAL